MAVSPNQPPSVASLATIAVRLTMLEHCIVRSNADAADQIRELARLVGGVVDYLQHRDSAPASSSSSTRPPSTPASSSGTPDV